MKVTHIFWSLGFGGIETMLVNIANAQAEAGSEVSVLIINELYEQSLVNSLDKRVNLVFLNRKKGAITPWFIVRLNRILERSKPDVIHLHRSDLYHFVWGKKLKSKVCITLHALPKGLVRREGVMHIVWRKIKKRSVLYSNVVDMDRIPHVFTISEVVQKTLYDNYGVESTVVCNGIVTSCFVSRPKTMPKGQLRVVMVSRLEHDKKGQDLLIRAAAALQGTVTVDFIGIGSSMGWADFLIGVAVAIGVIVAFMNGFHDAANAIATVVSTRVMKPHTAVAMAAVCNIAAIFVFELKVAATVGKGTIEPHAIDYYVVFGALVGAIAWNVITWYYGIPSSSSHAVPGIRSPDPL
jgi:hypothetical protein